MRHRSTSLNVDCPHARRKRMIGSNAANRSVSKTVRFRPAGRSTLSEVLLCLVTSDRWKTMALPLSAAPISKKRQTILFWIGFIPLWTAAVILPFVRKSTFRLDEQNSVEYARALYRETLQQGEMQYRIMIGSLIITFLLCMIVLYWPRRQQPSESL